VTVVKSTAYDAAMPHPRLWAGLAPFGIGRTKPHHYLEMARAAWRAGARRARDVAPPRKI